MSSKQMPDRPKFTKEDLDRAVELLNFVATHAEFARLSVKHVLTFTKLLNWAQTQLLSKIEANTFEVVSVKDAKK